MAIDTTKTVTGITYNGTPLALPTPSGKITITANGNDIDVSQYASADVNVPAPAPVSVDAVDEGVNFIDYDGTVLYTWKASEVAGKTALPDNPSHEGLTAQGWNWTLADIQSAVLADPEAAVTVGQNYVTDDGKTRIYVSLDETTLSPKLGLRLQGTVEIDWGDGTKDTATGNSANAIVLTPHTYAGKGDYRIVISLKSGSYSLGAESSYWAAGRSPLFVKGSTSGNENLRYLTRIKKVELGTGTDGIFAASVLSFCLGLETVTIPAYITNIGGVAFGECRNLRGLVIPRGTIKADNQNFTYCVSMKNISLSPQLGNTFAANGLIQSYGLKRIYLPDTITAVNNGALNMCYALRRAHLPKNITALNNVFQNCYSLVKIKIPASVASIAANCFNNCYSLAEIRFLPTTPPTVANANAFTNVPTDCVIKVPRGSLNAYKTATNYPSPTTYTYEEYDG